MKLGSKQKEFLSKVCKSNGGGVPIITANDLKISKSLEKKGLIQGKSNGPGRAVHTKAGIDLFKELEK